MTKSEISLIVKDHLKKYPYLILSKPEMRELINDVYTKSKLINNRSIEVYIAQKINSLLFSFVNMSSKSSIIINNYINYLFDNKENVSKLLKELNKFLTKYYWNKDLDVAINVLNINNSLLLEISNIVNNNNPFYIPKHYKDTPISIFFEVYCMNNNINIIEAKEDKSDDNDLLPYKMLLSSFKPLLSPVEEQNLAKRIAEGDKEAKDEFVERNLRLVASIARKYVGRGLVFDDLFQNGTLGLMRAVDGFDYSRNLRFSTYATIWIREYIERSLITEGKTVRIPVYLANDIARLHFVERTMEFLHGKVPTEDEIASELGINFKKLRLLREADQSVISLDSPVSQDEGCDICMIDNLQSESSTSDEAINIVHENEIKKSVLELFEKAKLTEREREILIARNMQEPKTLAELGSLYGVTRECVRQAESRAMKKIRKLACLYNYSSFLDNPEKARRNLTEFVTYYKEPGNTKYAKTPGDTKWKSIYTSFHPYGKVEVDYVIENYLSLEEKEIMNKCYSDEITEEYYKLFVSIIVPKIKHFLKQNYPNRTKKK